MKKTAAILVAAMMIGGAAQAALVITLQDAGGGTTDMTLSGSGTVTSVDSWFTYDTLTPTFHGTAEYENITITPVPTGPDSAPFVYLRIRSNFASGSRFQLWTGEPSVNSPFDLSAMNGTYNIPVNFELLNGGTWDLSYNSGMNIGPVSLTVTSIPEPATAFSIALGSLLIVGCRRFFGRV